MFRFISFEEKHLPRLRVWLNADHIKRFWQETDDDEKLKTKFLSELPLRGVAAFVIEINDSIHGKSKHTIIS